MRSDLERYKTHCPHCGAHTYPDGALARLAQDCEPHAAGCKVGEKVAIRSNTHSPLRSTPIRGVGTDGNGTEHEN